MEALEMNIEEQRAILKNLTNEQLFESLKMNFNSINEGIFCIVRTKENLKKLTFLILDEFRSRNIFICKIVKNKWERINHFNFTYEEKFIKVYDKIKNEMIFTSIGTY